MSLSLVLYSDFLQAVSYRLANCENSTILRPNYLHPHILISKYLA